MFVFNITLVIFGNFWYIILLFFQYYFGILLVNFGIFWVDFSFSLLALACLLAGFGELLFLGVCFAVLFLWDGEWFCLFKPHIRAMERTRVLTASS